MAKPYHGKSYGAVGSNNRSFTDYLPKFSTKADDTRTDRQTDKTRQARHTGPQHSLATPGTAWAGTLAWLVGTVACEAAIRLASAARYGAFLETSCLDSMRSSALLVLAAAVGSVRGIRMQLGGGLASRTKLLVIGGNGFVGSEVCRRAVEKGFDVTSLSRRGVCPDPNDELLSQVNWQAGNALEKATVTKYVNDADAVVHAIGLLFDVDSGLKQLNFFTSASGSKPDESSTYDNITRKTALMVIAALNARALQRRLLGGGRTPMAFVSCAEAGWTDVTFGPQVRVRVTIGVRVGLGLRPLWLARRITLEPQAHPRGRSHPPQG